MKTPLPNKTLKYLVGALVVATTLSTYWTLGEKPSGLPQKLEAAKVVQDAPGVSARVQPAPAPAAPPQQESSVQPSRGLSPAAPSKQSPSTPGAPPTRLKEEVGRPNPFAPLVIAQRPLGPRGVLQPSSRPSPSSGPSAPWLGVGLPLPPGFTVPGGQGAPLPPPGAKMTVGAIVGGSERIAIITDLGKIFVVGVGDRVGDAVVVQILADKVVMRRGGVTFELRFEGGGS